MQQELSTAQEVAMKLGKHNTLLKEETAALRAQFKCQEDDRELLIRKNLVLQKEVDARKAQLENVRGQLEALVAQRGVLAERVESLQAAAAAAEGAGEGARVGDMRRLLEVERGRVKSAKSAHAAALAKQNEVQAALRALMDRVQAKRAAVEHELAYGFACGGSESASADNAMAIPHSGLGAAQHSATGGASAHCAADAAPAGKRRPVSASAALSVAPLPVARNARGLRRRPHSAVPFSGPASRQHGTLPFGIIADSKLARPNSGLCGAGRLGHSRPSSATSGRFGIARSAVAGQVGLEWTPADLTGPQLDAMLQEMLASEELLRLVHAQAFPAAAAQAAARLPATSAHDAALKAGAMQRLQSTTAEDALEQ